MNTRQVNLHEGPSKPYYKFNSLIGADNGVELTLEKVINRPRCQSVLTYKIVLTAEQAERLFDNLFSEYVV